MSTGSHNLLEQRLPSGTPREAAPGRMSELKLMSTLRAVPTQVPTVKNPLSFQQGVEGCRRRNYLEMSEGSLLHKA